MIRSISQRNILLARSSARYLATDTLGSAKTKKSEGDISDAFASMSGVSVELPPRFADLKQAILSADRDSQLPARLSQSWADLLSTLRVKLKEIQQVGPEIVPEVKFEDLVQSEGKSNASWMTAFKERGAIVVRGVVDEELALDWKEQLCAYIKANPQVRGFPADNKQFFELYWSKPQLAARSHPNLLAASRIILSSTFHAAPGDEIALEVPISYCDRLRMRTPGISALTIGPHIDGGSLERWEDPTFRSVYKSVLSGNWRSLDPFALTHRLNAISDLYSGSSQCSILRPLQGWLSLSTCSPTHGTLRVLPLLREATSYMLLRPFFTPRLNSNDPTYLEPENWSLDTSTSAFPGSVPGCGQELSPETHPHLNLESGGIVSMRTVRPGDFVLWHCDTVHAVEKAHEGTSDSSVFYIPAAPLTPANAAFLARQRAAFQAGTPSPDFPGGDGERAFDGAGRPEMIEGKEARRAMGLERFEIKEGMPDGAKRAVREANRILGF